MSTDARADGTASFGNLPLGEVRLAAFEPGPRPEPDRVAPADWTLVTPESPEATLRIAPLGPPGVTHPAAADGPPRLTVTVRAKEHGAGSTGTLTRRGEGTFPRNHQFKLGDNGEAVVIGVEPGRYTVWIRSGPNHERCAYLPDVEVSAAPIEVELVPTASIRFRLKLPAGSKVDHAVVEGPLGDPWLATLGEDGVYEARGLPPGTWTIRAKVRAPTAWLYAKVEAATGTETEVEPQPRK
jgi:hypothetical protein